MKSLLRFQFKTVLALSAVATAAVALGAGRGPGSLRSGGVYTMTNQMTGNELVVYQRAPDGTIAESARVPTGGLGTSAGLGNQSGIAMSRNGRFIYTCNAASNDISVLTVKRDAVMLHSVVPSGGQNPISVAVHDDLVYVLNAGSAVGGTDEISGFITLPDGSLDPIPGSILPLSGPAVGPAQVGFSTLGNVLIVTEKATNQIDTYTIDAAGLAHGPMVQPSVGITPFGFSVTNRNVLIVSEANAAVPGSGSATAYFVEPNGQLTLLSASVPTMQTAACWATTTANGRYAYTTNTPDGSITGFAIDPTNGTLSLLDPNGVSAITGAGSRPLDAAIVANRFIYALAAGTGEIHAFTIASDGSLAFVGLVTGLPSGTNGLIAR